MKSAPSPTKTRVARRFDGIARQLAIRAATDEEQAKGFCGMLQGVALAYNQPDAYGTLFKPGCLDRTRAAKVPQRKIKFYLDHTYSAVKTHVGTVLSLEDRGEAAVMTAGLFNTAAGRDSKEYLQAVLDSESETGLSIGFYERAAAYEPDGDGDTIYAFSEIELDEISLTPRPAVPGALVTGVRKGEDRMEAAERLLGVLAQSLPPDRVRAIVKASLAGHAVLDEPQVTAPAAAGPDEGRTAAHASTEDDAKKESDAALAAPATNVTVVERLTVLRTALANL
jgi:HK97 family phage prohead protease